MPESLRDAIAARVVLADGAMGTELYRRGVFINRCYDALNVQQPDLVAAVHADYLAAGAELHTANTYGANRVRLSRFGLEDQIGAINAAGIRLAREVVGEGAFVAASIGPMPQPLQPAGPLTEAEVRAAWTEQVEHLLEAGADVVVLETFRQLSQLELAIDCVRSLSADVPLIASFAFKPNRHYFVGPSPEEVARRAASWRIDVLGTNCINGPQALLDLVERLEHVAKRPLAAMPNAGQPEIVDGRSIYMASPEYMAEYARRYVQHGARIVGGCCGTTPEMIAEMARYLRSVEPRRRPTIEVSGAAARERAQPAIPLASRSAWGRGLAERRFQVSVELDAPRGLDSRRPVDGARRLHEAGIAAVNIADGPRASARMSALALALQVREACDIEVIVHYCCRDRNLLGMQMDLLGAHALGIHNVLCVTGDPPKMGNYPDATGVFDLDSVGLINAVHNLNTGTDFGGDPMPGQAGFVIGCGCNPGATPLDREVDKFRRKVEAGAEFAFSQPVYDPSLLEAFAAATGGLQLPLFVGILPLASSRNAEFLHNEVPGMQIPRPIRERMARADSKEAQAREGIAIAAETLRHARSLPGIRGAYIFPPFGRYEAVLDVLEAAERPTEL